MKKLPFLLFAFVLTLNSCKKDTTVCYSCVSDNECYTLQGTKTCKADFTPISGITWDTYKAALIASGATLTTASATEAVCDNSARVTTLENSGYVCTKQ